MGRQDALLILAVVVFAGLVVLLVGRGLRDPAGAPRAGGEPAAAADARPGPEAAAGARRGPAEGKPGPASPSDPALAPAGGPRGSEARTALADRTAGRLEPGADPAAQAGESPGQARTSEALSEETDEADPGDGLSIAGRVLDDRGAPVAGIGITARRVGPNEPGRRDDQEHAAQSDADGSYAFGKLAEGEYQLRTSETRSHQPRTLVSRAGADAVDIVLTRRKSLRIRGTVTDMEGRPLANASVQPVGHEQGQSDEDGRYELALDSSSVSSVLLVKFSADGYRTEQKRLELSKAGKSSFVVDAKLETAEEAFRLEGRVRSSRGEPVRGQTVQLRSNRLHAAHQGSTGPDGRFGIDGFIASDDWRIHVQPSSEFADFRQGPLRLDRRSSPLDIVLEPVDGGRVTGRVVDPEGRPLPGFRLWLTSRLARGQGLEVVTDDSGRFSVDDVPVGALQFATRSVPWLRVSGVVLEERERLDVELVLDWGDYTLAGAVLGAGGDPLAGADVRLSWSDRRSGLQSSSFRRTVSDAQGRFRFAQIGRGEHVLEIRADGYQLARRPHGVSAAESEVEIRLQGAAAN